MRRPAVRFLLTLVTAVSIVGVVPATSEAGIIPWAWDTVFGPVGSIQARRAARHCGTYDCGASAGCYYGPAPRLFGGLRARRACCGTYGYAGYSGYDCSTCGTSCGTGCSTCGVGGYGDGGYVYGSGDCGPGGCASGQCNVNYPPGTGPTFGESPVTPATPPSTGNGAGGPSPNYDNTPGANKVIPPGTPGATTDDGFVPRGGKSPAPPTGDPTKDDQYIPPKVNPPEEKNGAVDANGNSTAVPAVTPGPASQKKKPTFGEDDEKGGSLGPRLELQEKVTWRTSVVRNRQVQAPVRVSATANRHGLFPKIAWRSGSETELAKK